MKIAELFELIQKTLAAEGFKPTPLFRNSMQDSYWTLRDELEKRKLADGWDAEAVFGFCLAVRSVPNFNDQKETVSYYLDILSWNRSSSKRLSRIKLSKRSSAGYLAAKAREFAEDYRRVLLGSEIESMIEGNPIVQRN